MHKTDIKTLRILLLLKILKNESIIKISPKLITIFSFVFFIVFSYVLNKTDVYFSASPVFKLAPEAIAQKEVTPLAWYASATTLRSGWAYGRGISMKQT